MPKIEEEDKHPYEYTETTSPLGPNGIELSEPELPNGIGWEFQEKIKLASLVIFRWKRRKIKK